MARNSLRKLSTQQLQVELDRRQRMLPRMQKRREALLGELREVEREIANLSGAPAGTRAPAKRRGRPPGPAATRRRARNPLPLAEVMAGIMSRDKPTKVADIAEAVRRTGYKSNARNFGTIVNQTLIKDPRFKQAGRAHYVLA